MESTLMNRGLLIAFLALVAGTGCTNLGQVYNSTRHENVALQAGDLEAHGLAFIGTSASTGREEDRQATALLFAQALRDSHPAVPVTSLSETLGKVNTAGLAEAYIAMYDDYRVTGLLRRDLLEALGKATGARYLGQLKLSSFSQESATRFGALGLRIINTKVARVRIFFQIWDSQTGSIAWEGVEELVRSDETTRESLITFHSVIEESAHNLIKRLPGADGATLPPGNAGTPDARPDSS